MTCDSTLIAGWIRRQAGSCLYDLRHGPPHLIRWKARAHEMCVQPAARRSGVQPREASPPPTRGSLEKIPLGDPFLFERRPDALPGVVPTDSLADQLGLQARDAPGAKPDTVPDKAGGERQVVEKCQLLATVQHPICQGGRVSLASEMTLQFPATASTVGKIGEGGVPRLLECWRRIGFFRRHLSADGAVRILRPRPPAAGPSLRSPLRSWLRSRRGAPFRAPRGPSSRSGPRCPRAPGPAPHRYPRGSRSG